MSRGFPVTILRGIINPSEARGGTNIWSDIKGDFRDTFGSFSDTGKTLIYISHAKPRDMQDRHGTDYTQVVPACMPSCFEILKAVTDVAAYLGYRKLERTLFLHGGETIWTSNGIVDRFVDHDVINMGSNPEEAYQNLEKAYHTPAPKANKDNNDN